MAKEVIGKIKLQLQAGKANPAPPVGPALGQHGVNIPEFCKAFNAQTQEKMGFVIPVEISVYADRSFTFILKTPPQKAFSPLKWCFFIIFSKIITKHFSFFASLQPLLQRKPLCPTLQLEYALYFLQFLDSLEQL